MKYRPVQKSTPNEQTTNPSKPLTEERKLVN